MWGRGNFTSGCFRRKGGEILHDVFGEKGRDELVCVTKKKRESAVSWLRKKEKKKRGEKAGPK